MTKNKEIVLFSVISLLVGVVLAGLVAGYSVNSNNTAMMRMMGMQTNPSNGKMLDDSMTDHMGMSMEGMSSSLSDKTGDNFDKAFIAQMIDHHQGAIDMANLAKQNAKHDEIKQMADDIISAQAGEIKQMQSWQQQWGY